VQNGRLRVRNTGSALILQGFIFNNFLLRYRKATSMLEAAQFTA
jgi:hypothetical protein